MNALYGFIALVNDQWVMTGNLAAIIVGVVVAAVSMLANFAALPIYPVWSLILIAIDVLVIWALIVHGREMKRGS